LKNKEMAITTTFNQEKQLDLIKDLIVQQQSNHIIVDNGYYYHNYIIIPANPATGILYVTKNSPDFISGHLRMRGRNNGSYPYKYLEMIDSIFGKKPNTIEVCSNSVAKGKDCFRVDINPATNPDLVCDGQTLNGIADSTFDRWRCDPPYSLRNAKNMYGCNELPNTGKLLKAGARVCKPGSLMFMLLGPENHQACPSGVKRIGLILITIVPNNEIRALNIYYKLHIQRTLI
jgi:hypothetical protein